MAAAVNNKPNLWYVHSPIREIWDLYEYTRQNTVPRYAHLIFDAWVKYNRYLNRKYIKSVDKLACNSQNTCYRIKKYLNREAVVINPPIETSAFHYAPAKDYWLSVNRLISHKRVDMQLKAFRELTCEKLIIVGSYEKSAHFRAYAAYIKSIKPENVEILSWVDKKKLIDLYANCKGFIATAEDEDFGMTLVEAMASGKPVIAANEGGYKETVVAGVTGKLLDNINETRLIAAIKEVGTCPQQYKTACIEHARKFDTEVFIRKIKEQLQ
jgi:glycosyltransferase involved in cell wall biosynthesis